MATERANERAGEQAGADGVTRIVEVGAKPETERTATAECWVSTTPDAVGNLVAGTKKGDPIQTAKIAGVIGVKQTPALLPHCHPIRVTGADVVVEPDEAAGRLRVETTVRAIDRTGVEMEALTAAAVGLLTVYDMVKAVDRGMTLCDIRLEEKHGGKSGAFRRAAR
jgi:cyclic pyranopterin monophosphate synthase